MNPVNTWSQATESESESEEKGNVLILAIPIPSSLRLQIRLRFLIQTDREAPYDSDSDSFLTLNPNYSPNHSVIISVGLESALTWSKDRMDSRFIEKIIILRRNYTATDNDNVTTNKKGEYSKIKLVYGTKCLRDSTGEAGCRTEPTLFHKPEKRVSL